MTAIDCTVEGRALQSRGESGDPIYTAAARALRARGAGGAVLDVGCGTGRLQTHLHDFATSCIGVDVVRHAGLPNRVEFVRADLDRESVPLREAIADVVVAIETIEHVENPRAFFRELVRLARPGGWLLVTTPNQLSALSLMCLIATGQFAAFQDNSYPAHRTALLPIDLVRIARENRVANVEILYTEHGRIPLTPVHYPRALSRLFPRTLSDHVMLVCRKHA